VEFVRRGLAVDEEAALAAEEVRRFLKGEPALNRC
jgi:hypothetical protein